MYMSCNCHKNSNNNIENTVDFVDPIETNNYNYCDDDNNECSCGYDEDNGFPTNVMYGHAYVPNQKMNKTFSPDVGLKMGTIFPELVSPYLPNQSIAVIEYLKARNEIGEGCNK